MPVTSTPQWSAPQAGILGDAAAVAGSASVNQLLGTHPAGLIYQGNPILTPTGAGGSLWSIPLATEDVDQPFTMSGTVIGRVQIPLLPVGNGADLLVSLCKDNSGQPGAMITQTRIPAAWISQIAAVSGEPGPSTAVPSLQFTNNPLAASQFNGFIAGAPASGLPFAFPAGSDGTSINPEACYNAPGYVVYVGGQTNSGAVQQTVFSVPVDGTGVIGSPIPQPAMPAILTGTAAIVQTDPTSGTQTLFVFGGVQSTSSTPVLTSVYGAPFNASSGAVGSWSTQAVLPTGVCFETAATYGEYVYVLGGSTTSEPSLTATTTVQFAQVQNGQISTWSTTTPLPVATTFGGSGNAVAINGIMYVLGGRSYHGSWWAPINSDGTLGTWRQAPYSSALNFQATVSVLGDYGLQLAAVTGADTGFLSLTESGMTSAWEVQAITTGVGGGGGFPAEAGPAGYWQGYIYSATSATTWAYATYPIALTPLISVPLPATGLTNGATYHVLIQQQGGDLNDYLRTHTDTNAFPGNPTAQTSSRNAYAWTALSPAGTCIPLQIFDQTVPYQGAMPVHSWEDSGAKISTLVCATTPDQRLLGLCEATRIQTQRNQNAGFESGIAPWQVFNGAVAQSSTQVKEGSFSAQITPNGTSSQVFMQSELLPCLPGQQITVNAWVWATSAITSNFSLSVNWYTIGGTLISTSSNSVSIPAATWTQLTNTFTAPSAGTLPYQYALVPTLGGTPASSNVFYVDQCYATDLVTPQLPVVTGCNYPAAWPGATSPMLSTTVLA